MAIPHVIKEASKIIGYFSYTKSNLVYCDADACIIAGSDALMKSYLAEIPNGTQPDIIKKTRFSEIIQGMIQGGAYAFDEESYSRFSALIKINKIVGLPTQDIFLQYSKVAKHFIRVSLGG